MSKGLFLLTITICLLGGLQAQNAQKEFKPKPGFSPVTWSESLDPDKDEKIRKELGEGYKRVRPVQMSPELLETWQETSLTIINARKTADANKIYATLTCQYWAIDAVFVDVFGPKDLTKGMWIKFNDDHTYEYGRYENISGKGIYHYDGIEEIILLRDNDRGVKPLEFSIFWAGNYIVFEGTKMFDDADLNIKLTGGSNQPVKEKE
jgi:hypothetical protein